MKKNILQILILIFVATISCPAQAIVNEWRGIRPLYSTRNDVEKLLGTRMLGPTIGKSYLYDTEEVRVTISYSEGTCKENKSSIFNVPKGTVLNFLVSFKGPLSVREIIDKSPQPFEKVADWKMERVFHYFSKDGTVQFETRLLPDMTEDVGYIIYKPSKADDYLRCSSKKPAQKTN